MSKIILSHNQNVRAAILFLNMFDLVIEEKTSINVGDTLQIYEKSGEVAGTITFNGKVISIDALTSHGLLRASYDAVTTEVNTDLESFGTPKYALWSTNISYQIFIEQDKQYNGTFVVFTFVDSKLGLTCVCRPSLEYTVNGNKLLSLSFLNDFYLLKAQFKNGDTVEEITMEPFATFTPYLKHVITKGKHTEKGYEYRKWNSISPFENNQLKLVSITEEYDKTTDYYYSQVINEAEDDDSKKGILQKGFLMNMIDPGMYETINRIRILLTSKGISLLDAFISLSLDSYCDEEVKALLGIERVPIRYCGIVRKRVEEIYFDGQTQLLDEKKD